MCGILAVFGCIDNSQAKRSRIIELSRRLRHRGPDWSGLHTHDDCYLAHQRLAIVDPTSGDQPLYNEDKTIIVAVNGEIYNHMELRDKLKSHQFRTGSDCEVIAHLYEEYGENFVDMLDGMFSFVLLDTRDKSFIAARDAIGITPLYMGWGLDDSSLETSSSRHGKLGGNDSNCFSPDNPFNANAKEYLKAQATGTATAFPTWSVWFSSEMKALSDDCERFVSFLPGGLRRWYNPPWFSETIPSAPYDHLVLRKAFEKAVVKRLMTDVPFGVLLSGGLDSSLVAAVANRYLADTEAGRQWGSQLHTFCVGLKDLQSNSKMEIFLIRYQMPFRKMNLTFRICRFPFDVVVNSDVTLVYPGFPSLDGSPDLKAAREVADYLGTRHHEFHFTVQEGIDALEEVIYHVETYDVTTIRASTPMFLMSRKIKSLGVKMVLSGEGSDEIFGGYLYFHKAPNNEEFHQETCRKIKALHLYDCLRANKSTSAWGVEARVPFLDKEFINVAMNIDPEWKMIRPDLGRIEKWVVRNAFDDDQNPYLPKADSLSGEKNRQKEQFSDGVGYSWIDGLKDHAGSLVSDSMLANASFVYPHNTPTTKEGYYYRTIFERYFPKIAARETVPGGPSVACSTAKAVEWDAAWSKNLDPSGRAALGVHAAAYEDKA
ncbi:hypothetical protein RND71_014622 [Anisodus tanguticus]|uniref:Asparagine synthetase [glutamine-hydrolyzing] n=1 Tax=Anisodus tanguticus TaxID=243964 RepID=A0AAE1VF74_9SOLA|nr:hypothetical protein RND71_014622 [Anisodus tanguticus]